MSVEAQMMYSIAENLKDVDVSGVALSIVNGMDEAIVSSKPFVIVSDYSEDFNKAMIAVVNELGADVQIVTREEAAKSLGDELQGVNALEYVNHEDCRYVDFPKEKRHDLKLSNCNRRRGRD